MAVPNPLYSLREDHATVTDMPRQTPPVFLVVLAGPLI
jgi:hypothetical protein